VTGRLPESSSSSAQTDATEFLIAGKRQMNRRMQRQADKAESFMDLTHIHLLLNHFPTIGYIIGGGLFLLSLIAKSDDLKRASLVILLGIALIAIPTYMSGNGAADAIKSLPGVSKSLIETHEGAALVAMGFMLFTGGFAWLGLWQFRRLHAYRPGIWR
jgi:sulfite exporter TauE/SafE